MRESRLRRRVLGIAVGCALATAALVPAGASAAFHLMKVSEVYPGTDLDPSAAFVELQMYSGGQNFVSGHTVRVYSMSGAVVPGATSTFSTDVASGQTQRTILVGDTSVPDRDSDGDFGPSIDAAGGAVCFDTIDCVAWGAVNTAALPAGANVGTPAPPIPDGSSLTRSIAPGCATLLEASDDTDNSTADFTLTATETPRPNGVAPTEVACSGSGGGAGEPETIINKGPRKQTTKRKAKFKFTSPDAATGFECSIDGKAFKACSSPKKYKRLKRKKHTFEVRAIGAEGTDPTPATYKWKIRKPKK